MSHLSEVWLSFQIGGFALGPYLLASCCMVHTHAQYLYSNWPQYGMGIITSVGVEWTPRTSGDLNGDGIVDLVLSRGSCSPLICINDGTGRFKTSYTPTAVPCGTQMSCVALADVDGDGDLDLLVGHALFADSPVTLFRNDGHGVFTFDSAALPTTLLKALSIVGLDVDRDGDQDLVIGCADTTQARLYLNQGGGNFVDATALRMPGCTDRIQGIAVLDVNQDGWLDFVTAAGGYYGAEPSRLFVNDGTGRFTFGNLSAVGGAMRVRVGDLNRDGLPDLVIAYYAGQPSIYINDGVGGFRDETFRFPAGQLVAYDVAVFDADADGDLDIVLCILGSTVLQSPRLFLNDGQGHFSDVTYALQPYAPSPGTLFVAVEVGDFDADGDPDMFFIFGATTFGAPNTTFFFHLRRHIVTQPVVTVGQNITFTHYALPGHGIVAAVSAGAAPVQLGSLGRLWLDPAQMVLLTPFLIGASGKATLTMSVPLDNRLRGMALWTQAIDIEPNPPFAGRLTNAVWDVIK